ncbi:hypothetical protein [Methylobacterium sp. PvR107]|uniref:hypothetical protein n=1 Tax=Methylobacterium sp. PvR107 TaxID=2806597 RepID=UPI001AEA906B|nr:hypothetical protein [Methylobacterium sp. PvR107]MBP1179995.1 hypothetical protein [Methylobacterium sp. PvR107]
MTTLATLADDVLSVSAGAFSATITANSISGNFDALTHFPDRRARIELGDLCNGLNYFGGRLDKLASEGGAVDLVAEAARFAERHVALHRRAWAMEARCMSWFIVGPANFPTARNQKRQASRDKAYDAIRAHTEAALRSIERTAWPHGAPGDAIRANNPDAASLLRARIEQRRATHARMKTANAVIRETKGQEIEARILAMAGATGFSRADCERIVNPPERWMGQGFAAYALSGELTEIKRLEGRLRTLEANAARGTVETQHNTSAGALTIRQNPDAARVQLIFPGKPDEETRTLLKSNGFRWAPSEGAWQRHLNNAGRYAAKCVLSALQVDESPAPAPQPAPFSRFEGRDYPTARRIEGDDAANAFMGSAEGAGFGVLYVAADGAVIVASCNDMGRAA